MKKYDIMILSGGFDPLHKGHIRMFKAAKNMAHKVIVGINSDDWLVKKKERVFMNFAERSEIIKSIEYVDDIMPFNDDDETAMDLLIRIHRLYPHNSLAFGNGGSRSKITVPEKGFCEAYNIDTIFSLGGGMIHRKNELEQKLLTYIS